MLWDHKGHLRCDEGEAEKAVAYLSHMAQQSRRGCRTPGQLSVLHSRVAESPSLTHTRMGGVILCHHTVVMSSSLPSGKEKSRITNISLKLLRTSRTRTIDYYLPLKILVVSDFLPVHRGQECCTGLR